VSGNATDTNIVTITVRLPDGGRVTVTGEDDGVNGFLWEATFKPLEAPLAFPVECDVHEKVLIDGVVDEGEAT